MNTYKCVNCGTITVGNSRPNPSEGGPCTQAGGHIKIHNWRKQN